MAEEQETAEDVVNEVVEQVQEAQEMQQEDNEPQEEVQQQHEEEKVPLSALKKVREEKQEARIRAEILEKELTSLRLQSQQPAQEQVDNSNDLLTVGQQQTTLNEWKRSILEEAYMEQNPDIAERVKHELPEILSNPKHKWLADSITQAPNRLQRAAQILEMFGPKKQVAAPPPNRTQTPKSPQSVAKTNKLSIADRIMKMSDQELEEWRVSQKRNIR